MTGREVGLPGYLRARGVGSANMYRANHVRIGAVPTRRATDPPWVLRTAGALENLVSCSWATVGTPLQSLCLVSMPWDRRDVARRFFVVGSGAPRLTEDFLVPRSSRHPGSRPVRSTPDFDGGLPLACQLLVLVCSLRSAGYPACLRTRLGGYHVAASTAPRRPQDQGMARRQGLGEPSTHAEDRCAHAIEAYTHLDIHIPA